MLMPLRDVVIIEIDKAGETPAGIQLPESHKDPAGTDTGKILNIRTSYLTETGVRIYVDEPNIGDKVLFLRKHGIAVKGNKNLVCCRYENLLAVIED